jgi:hypothetical protein
MSRRVRAVKGLLGPRANAGDRRVRDARAAGSSRRDARNGRRRLLVRELFPPRERGYFLSGKFDFGRGEFAVSRAGRGVRRADPSPIDRGEDELARWRGQIATAIAQRPGPYQDAIPALERIIGSQPQWSRSMRGTQTGSTSRSEVHPGVHQAGAPLRCSSTTCNGRIPSIHLLKLVAMSPRHRVVPADPGVPRQRVADGHPLMPRCAPPQHRRVTRLDTAPLAAGDRGARRRHAALGSRVDRAAGAPGVPQDRR